MTQGQREWLFIDLSLRSSNWTDSTTGIWVIMLLVGGFILSVFECGPAQQSLTKTSVQ